MAAYSAEWREEGETLVEFLEARARAFGPRPALHFKPGFRYLT